MNELLISVINFFATILKSYPLTIIVVTLIIKFVMMPLDLYQRKNSRKQMALTAEVESIRKRYKDPQQANQKVQELYKKHGVSTLAGCLPLIFQLVFLVTFFNALQLLVAEQTTNFIIKASAVGADAVELPKWLWINNFWQPDSGFSSPMASTEEFLKFLQQNVKNISAEKLMLLSNSGMISYAEGALSVGETAFGALRDSVLAAKGLTGIANGWFGLPLITGISLFLQQKITMKNQPKDSVNDQMAATNSTMLYFMPIFSAVMCLESNSAFGLYWAVSNIYSITFTLIMNAIFNAKDRKEAKAA